MASYVIKVHDLITSFLTVPAGQKERLWREFLMDPRPVGITDQKRYLNTNPVRVHMSMEPQSSSVGVVPFSLFLSCHGVNFGRNSFQRTDGVNLAAFCLLLSCHGLNFGRNYFQILCMGPGIP